MLWLWGSLGAENKNCLGSSATMGRLNELGFHEALGGRGVDISLSAMSSYFKNP